ncbi:MAG: HPr family phosphocarrier protein [Lachnospiraceae bacterium]|nr:HPr family phosphocarrier protein [Lachnospiraceae bacterium]
MTCFRTDSREKLFVTFRSEEEIISFVEVCNRYDDAIDVRQDRFVADAKSVMGMLLVELNIPHEVIYECFDDDDNYAEFRNEIAGRFAITTD